MNALAGAAMAASLTIGVAAGCDISPPPSPDSYISDENKALYRGLIADETNFWNQTGKGVTGVELVFVEGDGTSLCLTTVTTAESNPNYCPYTDDIRITAETVNSGPGNSVEAVEYTSHEMGHAKQGRMGSLLFELLKSDPERLELGADCLSGVFMGAEYRQLIMADIVMRAIMGNRVSLLYFGDDGKHGTFERRQEAFARGVAGGEEACTVAYNHR